MTFGSGNLDLRRRAAVVAARKTRVLVVDDDEGFTRFLAALLHSAGYCVVTAANADEAIATSRQARIDAVLVDVVMPGRGG